MSKPHAARLVAAMEVDVNVYPPNRGRGPFWNPDSRRDVEELILEAVQSALAEREPETAESSPDSSDDETGEA